MNEPADEADLLDALRAGDQAALAELYARYRDKLRRMVTLRLDHRVAGRVSPSDVLQDAYIDAVKRYSHFFEKPDQSFFGWLRLIVAQRMADLHRDHLQTKKRDARQEISLQAPANHGATSACLAGWIVGAQTSPSGVVDRRERIAKLEAALDELEPLDREVLALRHFEELSNTDTAAALDIQPAAASKRYVRALARLKTLLEELAP